MAGDRGWQPWTSEPFELHGGETRVQDVELEKAAGVKGTVLLPNGQPAAGAWVSLGESPEHEGLGLFGTDAGGQFRIPTAIPGRRWLKVTSSGYRELVREVEIAPGENRFELTLEPGSIEVEGRVLDREGAPVAGAQVLLAGGRRHYEVTGEADGRVRLTGLESGSYRLMIRKQGFVPQLQDLRIEASRQDLEWRLEPAGARLGGAVLGLADTGCADLTLRVRRGREMPVAGKCENGRYAVEDLGAGTYTLVAASAAAGRVAIQAVEIPEGQAEVEKDLDFRNLAGPWSGRLRLGDRDLRNVRYSLDSAFGRLLSGVSAEGIIEFYAPPGRYRLDLFARPMEDSKELEIEIGSPTEQLIDAGEP